ncbi:hypothetical protein ACHAW5_005044 [Stephanodiscus triporus]|uniref:Uncharacterized protein n=1 Tax=Stephanodiscus triporus TaxID=2934178 RepID=A0ABD3QIL8_9STRA
MEQNNPRIGLSPLSTNANIGNVPLRPSLVVVEKWRPSGSPSPSPSPSPLLCDASDLRETVRVRIHSQRSAAKADSSGATTTMKTPPRSPSRPPDPSSRPSRRTVDAPPPPSSSPRRPSGCDTPRSSPMSLPRCHFPPACPSRAVVRSYDLDDDDDSSVSTDPASPASSSSGSVEDGPVVRRARPSPSDVVVVECRSAMIEDVRSKLLRNRLRRESSSDSLRGALIGSHRDDDDERPTIEYAVRALDGTWEKTEDGDVVWKENVSWDRPEGTATTARVLDLAPTMDNDESVVRGEDVSRDHPEGTAPATKAIWRRQTSTTATSTQQRQRVEKCLRDALQAMQSGSWDSRSSSVGDGGAMSSSSSTSDDPFHGRLTTKLLGYSMLASGGNDIKRGETHGNDDSDVGRCRAESGDPRSLLGLGMSKGSAIVASSTFSISPMTKESKSTAVRSYLDSIRVTDSSEATNLFDMLRNGKRDEKVEDESDEVAVTLRASATLSSRPPLSPTPPALGVMQSATRHKKPLKTNPSTKTFRGTPSRSPCSNASSSSILDSKSATTTPQSTCNQLEFSFQANALMSTNILAKSSRQTHDRLGDAPRRKDTSGPSQKTVRLASSKRSYQELSYASVGATSSAFKTTHTRTFDPMATALEAEMMALTRATLDQTGRIGGCHSMPWKKQRTPTTLDDQDDDEGPDEKINNPELVNPKSMPLVSTAQAAKHHTFPIESALDDTFSLDSNKSQEKQPFNLSNGMNRPKESQALKNNKNESMVRQHGISHENMETFMLQDPVNLSEEIIGLDRRDGKHYKSEFNDLMEQKTMLEHRLEEQMALNEELNQKALAFTTYAEAAREVHKQAEECLRSKIKGLESELESERSKHTKTIHGHSSVVQSLQSQISWHKSQLDDYEKVNADAKVKDMNLEELRRINKGLSKKQKLIERELVSCANDNDNLRLCLLSHASDAAAKEQTLSSALSQLKSLSERYYQVTQSLEYEKNARQDEVTSLQWSLDDVSRQMVLLSKTVNELQSENGFLRNEIKRQSLERQRSFLFRRGARGGL